jgi:protein FAM50
MTDYKGALSEGTRVRALAKQREEQQREMSEAKAKIAADSALPSLHDVAARFDVKRDSHDSELVSRTVGYKTRDEFLQTSASLRQLEEEKSLQRAADERAAAAAAADNARKRLRERELSLKAARQRLSFAADDDGDDDDDDAGGDGDDDDSGDDDAAVPNVSTRSDVVPAVTKNPFIDTTFLPDREREQREAELKAKLAADWQAEQERIKAESIEITYSYWDGAGHRKTTTMTKGATIAAFLAQVRSEFPRELRGVSIENLMYIKEDLIIPSHYTFYDLIVTKARGKSGPLFHFDVHDDVRVVSDARIEKDESHAGKVVERRWYESNKTVFPASRWESFDPNKTFEKFTIHDS